MLAIKLLDFIQPALVARVCFELGFQPRVHRFKGGALVGVICCKKKNIDVVVLATVDSSFGTPGYGGPDASNAIRGNRHPLPRTTYQDAHVVVSAKDFGGHGVGVARVVVVGVESFRAQILNVVTRVSEV